MSGWSCAENGRESPWLGLGDDTGWIDQKINLVHFGYKPVCFRFKNYSRSSGKTYDTGWRCTSSGLETGWIWIGDDTGYKDQKMNFRNQATKTQRCIRHSRRSGSSSRVYDTGWKCSKSGKETGWFTIGDDTGYRDQKLKFK